MWKDLEPNRWSWEADNDRHLLLRQGDVFVEVHASTVHVYLITGPEPLRPVEGGWLMDGSITDPDIKWFRTVTDSGVAELDDAQVWGRMAEIASE